MKIEVSNGEVLDKITILEIKKSNITDVAKLENVEKELTTLKNSAGSLLNDPAVESGYSDLLHVNKLLWDIEDKLREKERDKQFDREFVELARKVYFTNDRRAEIKKRINLLTGSELVEEKSYEQY